MLFLEQEYAARYCLQDLDEVLAWPQLPIKDIYTHPQLFNVSAVTVHWTMQELLSETTG